MRTLSNVVVHVLALALVVQPLAGPASAETFATATDRAELRAAKDRTAPRAAVARPKLDKAQWSKARRTPVPDLVPSPKRQPGPTRMAPLVKPRWVKLDRPNGSPVVGPETAKRSARVDDAAPASLDAALQSSSVDPPRRAVQVAPADNATSVSRTATFKAKVAEPIDGYRYGFKFTICNGTQNNGMSQCKNSSGATVAAVAESGWTDGSYPVPAGKLSAGKTYSWNVSVAQVAVDSTSPFEYGTIFNDVRVFSTGTTLSAPDTATPVLKSPADTAIISTRTPTLSAGVTRPVSGKTYEYQYSISSFDSQLKWDSAWTTSSTLTVPSSVLYWNRGYTWSVSIREKNAIIGTLFNPERSFYPLIPAQGGVTGASDGASPFQRGVNVGSGAFTSSSRDAAVKVSGGEDLELGRRYRSTDAADRAFGAGWASMLDMKVTTPTGAVGPVVQLADGTVAAFALNPNGQYVPAPTDIGLSLKKSGSTWVFTDRGGQKYGLDANGLLSLTTVSGITLTATRDSSYRVTGIKDATSGRSLVLAWSGKHVVSVTASPSPAGVRAVWTYAYTGTTLTKACVPGTGDGDRCTTYVHGTTSWPTGITKIVEPSGKTRSGVAYDSRGLATAVTDGAGSAWTFSRTATGTGTTVAVAAPEGRAYRYTLNKAGELIEYVDARGGAQQWTYDRAGRLGKYKDADGYEISIGYDYLTGQLDTRVLTGPGYTYELACYTYYGGTGANAGKLRSIQGLLGRCGFGSSPGDDYQGYVYDSKGRLSATTLGNPDVASTPRTVYTYTAGTETAPGGGTQPAGLLAATTDADGVRTTYAYDAAGNVASTKDADGLVTSFAYDSLGRRLQAEQTIGGSPRVTRTAWFDDGTLASETGPRITDPVSKVTRQIQTSTARTADGQVASLTRTDVVSGKLRRTRYTYDDLSRIVRVTDEDDRLVAAYDHDAYGNVTTETRADGSRRAYAYDANDHQTSSTALAVTRPGSSASPRDVVISACVNTYAGPPRSCTDADGTTTSYEYSGDHRVAKETVTGSGPDAPSRYTAYNYDDLGNLTYQFRTGHGSTYWTYDLQGFLTKKSTSSSTETYTRSKAGRETRRTTSDRNGVVDHFVETTYTSSGRVAKTVRGRAAAEQTTSNVYDERGLMTRTTTGNAVTDLEYDLEGNRVSVTSPTVRTSTSSGFADERPQERFGFDHFGRMSDHLDSLGARTTVSYDDRDNVTGLTLPAAQTSDGQSTSPTVRFEYDELDRRTSTTSPDGSVWRFEYDGLDHQTRVTGPPTTGSERRAWSATWSDAGNLLSTTDAIGNQETFSYDSLGRPRSVTDGEGRTSRYTYDAQDRLTEVIAPSGSKTVRAYSAVGDLTSVTDADGVKTSFGYDAAGRQTTSTTASSTTTTAYDSRGNPVSQSIADPGGAVVASSSRTFDQNDRVTTESIAGSLRRTWKRDGAGNATSVTFADGSTSAFGYDLAGQLTRSVDPRGAITDITYNAWGQVSSVREPAVVPGEDVGSRTWRTGYDVSGNAVTSLAPGGVATTRTFDPDGRILTESAKGDDVPEARRAYGYDAIGRLVSQSTPRGNETYAYDRADRLTSAGTSSARSSFTYDADGQLARSTVSGVETTYGWTGAGRPRSVSATGTSREYSYDSSGRVSRELLPGALTRSFDYDAAGRVLSDRLSRDGSSEPLSLRQREFDGFGRLSKEVVSPAGIAGAGTTAYTYDDRDRLTGWTSAGTTHAATYDAANNLTSVDGQQRTFDARNRLLSAGSEQFTYSARGTLQTSSKFGATTSRTYDGFDRLTSNGQSSYEYDSLDRVRTAGGVAVDYAGLEPEPSSVGAATISRGADQSVLGVGPSSVLTDPHGDVVVATDSNGVTGTRAYDPFGKVDETAGSSLGVLGFQGQLTDQGSVRMRSRWYDTATGSFTTRDDVDLPLTQTNRYAYADGDPVGRSDPSGHLLPCPPPTTLTCATGEAGAALGGPPGAVVGVGVGVVLTIGGLALFGSSGGRSRTVTTPLTFDIDLNLPRTRIGTRTGTSPAPDFGAVSRAGQSAAAAGLAASRSAAQVKASAQATIRHAQAAIRSFKEADKFIDQFVKTVSGLDFRGPDTPPRLTIRSSAVTQPVAFSPVAVEKACSGCVASGGNTGVGAITLPVDLGSSYGLQAPPAPDPLGGGAGNNSPPPPPSGLATPNPEDDEPDGIDIDLSTKGRSPDEVNSLWEYARLTNQWLRENGPQLIKSTKGPLRTAANRAAAAERLRADRAGTPYVGQAGHVPDTAISGTARPPLGWLDMPGVSNSVAGGALGPRIGQLLNRFTIDGIAP